MKNIFDNWVGFEESNFCKDMLKNEVSEFQDLDASCGIKTNAEELDEEMDDVKDDVNACLEPSLDEINKLVKQIKSLSVKVGDHNTSYSHYAVRLNDVADGICRTFH